MMWVGLRCVPPALSSTRHHTIALCDFTLFTLKALLILPGSFFSSGCGLAPKAWRLRGVSAQASAFSRWLNAALAHPT